MNLLDAVRVLAGGWRTLVVLPAAAGALVFGLTRDAPRTWKASAAVEVATEPASDLVLPGSQRTDSFAFKSELGNAAATLQSRSVLATAGEAAFDALLAEDAASDPAREDARRWLLAAWGAPGDVPGDPEATARLRAWALGSRGPLGFGALDEALTVRRPAEGNIVTLELSAEHRTVALLVLEAILDAFEARQRESREGAAASAQRFFEGRVAESRAALQRAEDALQGFRETNEVSNYDEQTRALALQIKDVDFALYNERAGAAASRSRREALEALMGGDAALEDLARSLAEEQAIVAATREEAAARAARAVAAALAGQAHVAPSPPASDPLRALYADRLGGLGEQRSALIQRWIQTRIEAEAGDATVAALQQVQTELAEDNRRYAALGAEVARLERAVGTAESEFLELLSSLNLARLYEQHSSAAPPFVVLDPVSAPEEPEGSKRLLLVAVASLATFTALAVLLLGLAWLDRGLYLPAELEGALGMPVWGAIPELRAPGQRPEPDDLAGRTPSGRLMVGCAQALEQALARAGAPLTVVVVAGRPGAGTTTVCRWLAALLASRGRRVALVPPGEAPPDAELVLVDAPSTSVSGVAFDRPAGATAALFVFDVGRPVDDADRRAVAALARAGAPVLGLVMNHAGYEAAEALLGHVPRARSRLRVWAKRVLTGTLATRRPWRT